jgi:hypothetical protein
MKTSWPKTRKGVDFLADLLLGWLLGWLPISQAVAFFWLHLVRECWDGVALLPRLLSL